MEKKYVMAFDQGTTSCRVLLFDKAFNVVAIEQQEFPQIYPQSGWVEHDPELLYNLQLDLAFRCLKNKKIHVSQVDSIGITNQRETNVLWDKITGKPLYNAIVWQDTRSTTLCKEWIDKGYSDEIRLKTGLVIDSYFSAGKIRWILDHVAGAKEKAEKGEVLFGTIDTWLIWNLTKGKSHVTDYSNASRTMLFNIKECCWDNELCTKLDIPLNILPKVQDSSSEFGTTNCIDNFPVKIFGTAGDQQAALFGHNCFSEGSLKNTYGTGCFMLMNTGDKIISSKHGLLTTIAWGIENKITYALEGSVFIAGAAMQWLRDSLGIIDNVGESSDLALTLDDNNGVYFVPAFSGMGAPYWDMYARGMIIGLTRETRIAHIARAALESIAYQTRDVADAMQADSGLTLQYMNVDGGASRNDFLMQFQSDILGLKIIRPNQVESTALGAACLAGLYSGFWQMKDFRNREQTEIMFSPVMSSSMAELKYDKWKQAVNRCLKWEQN
jgi:glycerol kinase